MIPNFVIVKMLNGKPAKSVFLAAEKDEVVVCDPGDFNEIKCGFQNVTWVSTENVFNFEEKAFGQLVSQWESSRTTSSQVWAALGRKIALQLPRLCSEH